MASKNHRGLPFASGNLRKTNPNYELALERLVEIEASLLREL
jgi:hypothetical protein